MTHPPFLLSVALLATVLGSVRADEAEELTKYDEQVLKNAGIGTNGADVLEFFRKRTLTADDLRTVPRLVRQLGDNDFDQREEASKKLTDFGPPVLPLLRPMMIDRDA